MRLSKNRHNRIFAKNDINHYMQWTVLCRCVPLLIPYCNLHELVLSCTSSYDAERRFILRRIPTSTLHKQRSTRATRKSPKKCADNLGAPRAPTKEQQRIPPEQVKQKEREPLHIFCCTCTFHPLIASDNAQIYRSYRHNHALNGKNRRPHDFLWFWRVPIPRGWPRFLIGKWIFSWKFYAWPYPLT